jgi:assimilatory nitrate reductase catalytic subunit
MLWEGWTDARYIAAHTTGFDDSRRRCATARPTVAQTCGIEEGRPVRRGALVRHLARHAEPVLPGPQPEQQRHGQERRADQPAPGHRPDRPAGRRPVFAHGPAQRHGRARGGRPGQPAQRPPRHGQPTAPRRSGGCGVWPSVPDTPGKTAVEMFQAAADGEIKALWIACTNPAQSMPDQATVRRALQQAELVVVQEAFATTATCEFADLLLPATTWGEKTGTVTNSERASAACARPCQRRASTRHDWVIATEFAQRLEARLRRAAHAVPLLRDRPRLGRGSRLERTPRIHARPRPGHHRHELRSARGRPPAMAHAAW